MRKRCSDADLMTAMAPEQETELYRHLQEQEKMLRGIRGVANLILHAHFYLL